MESDLALLDAWRDNDEEAGKALVQRHMPVLYRFFCTKVDSDIDELMQRTWLACVESRDRFRGDSTFLTYLLGIARNRLFEYFRQRARVRDRLDPGSASVADLGTSPTGRVARKREHALLLAAMRRIPLDAQITLELFYWENLTAGGIGEVLGLPENTVRSRINRAREALGDRLAELAETPQLLETTTSNLEQWAASLRDYLVADGAPVA